MGLRLKGNTGPWVLGFGFGEYINYPGISTVGAQIKGKYGSLGSRVWVRRGSVHTLRSRVYTRLCK